MLPAAQSETAYARGLSGSEPSVAEYLLAEMLGRQGDPVRRLLLRTSILERMNGERVGLTRLHSVAALWHAEPAGLHVVEETTEPGTLGAHRGGRVQVVLAVLRLSRARRHGDLPAVAEEVQRLLTFAEDPDWVLEPCDDLHALTLISLGIGELCTGQLPAAERHLEQGVAVARQIRQPSLELEGLAHWATTARERSFVVAADQSMEAVELARRHGWSDEPVTAIACAALGNAMVWQGQLVAAEPWLDRAERTLQAGAEPVAGILLHSARGTLELTRGREHEALAAFRAAARLAERLVTTHPLATRTRAGLLHILLRLGETERVEAALSELGPCQRDATEMRTVLAALRLGQDDPRAAAVALAPILGPAPALDRYATLVQPLLLEAVTREALGDGGAAERALELSLELAEPGGVVLPFLLHPAPRLLERHRQSHTTRAAFISRILNLLAETAGAKSERVRPEFPEEPLTDGEIRVLRYLPTHLTATEIARQLYLSVHTVTTHMRHIYAKLGVHRRHEAVDRARARGLLAPVSRVTLSRPLVPLVGQPQSATPCRRRAGPRTVFTRGDMRELFCS